LRSQDVNLSQRIHRLGYKLVYRHSAIIYHRNETTLRGLFGEGFQHGLWSVKCISENRAAVRDSGHRRVNLRSYKVIGANLVGAVTGEQRMTALCQATFDIGKKAGKIGTVNDNNESIEITHGDISAHRKVDFLAAGYKNYQLGIWGEF
jgi:hypothetical protein